MALTAALQGYIATIILNADAHFKSKTMLPMRTIANKFMCDIYFTALLNMHITASKNKC